MARASESLLSRSDQPETAAAGGPAPVGPGTTAALFLRFGQTLRDILLRPARFYAGNADSLASKESLSAALAFAIIVQWLASFFNFIWRVTVGVAIESRIDDLFRITSDILHGGSPGLSENLDQVREKAIEFFFGAGAIILTPFTTLIKLAVTALFVHAAVRFFMQEKSDRPHSYTTTLKILSYATAPWILCVIPGVGVVLAYVLSFMAAVVGLREVYRSSTGRSVIAVAFPEILMLAFFAGIFVLFLFLAFNVLRLVF